jgi:hypothetical protein
MRAAEGEAATPGAPPLTAEEMQPLWHWERRVTWLYVGAMAALLLAGLAASRFGELAWVQAPLLVGFAVLLVAAGVLHLFARCPRCGTRVRSGVLKMLPDKCSGCAVVFPRPPRS